MSNSKIKLNLTRDLNRSNEQVKSLKLKDPILINLAKQLDKTDFEIFKIKAKNSICKNVEKHWLNKSTRLNYEETLLVIDFEYTFSFDEKNSFVDADAYGINKWDGFEAYEKEFDMGYDFDFATNFDPLPGFSMNYLIPLYTIELGELEESHENFEHFIDRYEAILTNYKLKGYLILHDVLFDLERTGIFNELNRHENFMFTIKEHEDSLVTPLLTISPED